MNLSNNFNYTGNKANIDIGEIVVDFGFNYTPGQVKYVTATDEFETWRTIPKKTIPNPYGGGFLTVIPNASPPQTTGNLNWQRRQLWINNIVTGNTNVPLPAVTGKKWFLDSISFRSYDMHEFLPSWQPNKLIEQIGEISLSDLFIENAFGVGLDGLVIGYNTDDIVTWDTAPYTTASYPDFGLATIDETMSGLVPVVGAGKYGQNWETFDTLNQAGSRSAVVGGMLPSDWFPNQFSFNISGATTPTGIVTGLSDMIFGSDMFTTNRQGASNWSHTALPLQLSNMNIEIPYPYLGIEVYGGGYYHYVYWEEVQNASQTIKGINPTAPVPRTIVQFPIIAELIIVQR